MEAPLVSSSAGEKHVPNLDLAQLIYEYELDRVGNANLVDSIMEIIKEDEMADLYVTLCKKYEWVVNEELVATLKKSNEDKLEAFDAAKADQKENAGDMEVLEAQTKKARYLSQCGQWDLAYAAFDEVIAFRKISSGKKIDATFEKIRIALFCMELTKLKDLITDAKALIELGGDWDRRNRLKIYEALFLFTIRNIKEAAALLQDCVATFTCVELCSYEQFMFYTIVTNIMTLDRIQMKKKMVKNPPVLAIIREVPLMEPLLNSIYNCEYKEFFENIVKVHPLIEKNRYLGPHVVYIVREYRILAYSQFLEAYKSVMLSTMAANFGITPALMDKELARFIAIGRLNAKIDKVGDVVQTVRPDKKSQQYADVIKKGDALLNSIQKLARALDV